MSVRLTTFNHERYIKKALDGIFLQQTDFMVEIVLGDDFSSDRTLEIAKTYQNTNNIFLTILDRNKDGAYAKERKKHGRLYNFKDTLKNCTGKYIALLDGDDYWADPFKLQKQVLFLEANPGTVASYHNVDLVDEKGTVLQRNFIRDNNSPINTVKILKGEIAPLCSVVFRNLDTVLPKEFTKAQNGDLFLFYLLSKNGPFHYLGTVINACYRIHGGGVWSKKSNVEKLKMSLITFGEMLKIATKPEKKTIRTVQCKKL
ncbi:MAG: glycosyltransferase, partial [Marinirhabdus sp.]